MHTIPDVAVERERRHRARRSMRLGGIVEQNYDRLPYPAIKSRTTRFVSHWHLAPMEWIQAMWQPTETSPARVLVAGCGTGNEVFALHRVFPKAEIVGVDVSRRSLTLARELQQLFFRKARLQFLRVDLTQRNLKTKIGGGYDFVSCHGVLSYLVQPDRVIAALASCLGDGGALYLGINGAQHFSESWRPALADFGFDPHKFEEGARLRRILRLFDVVAKQQVGDISQLGAEYLAGDLFGPLLNNWSLSRWTRICRRCGLFLRGSYSAHHGLRTAINQDLYAELMPRTRPEAHALIEKIAPGAFHRLVFTPETEPVIPWTSAPALARYAVVRTSLYCAKRPARKKRRRALRDLLLRSKATNTRVDLVLPSPVVEVFRRSDSVSPLGTLLGTTKLEIPNQQTRKYLYLLYLLGAINLRPVR